MVYTFPPHLIVIPLLVAGIGAIAGYYFLTKRFPRKFSNVAFGICLLSGGILAPSMAKDQVVLDGEKLEQRTGFWFAHTVKGFRHSAVQSIRIATAHDHKQRPFEIWIVNTRDGRSNEIDPGDLWIRNRDDIIDRLRKLGVEIGK